MTLLRMAVFTLGKGISSSVPLSSTIFLSNVDGWRMAKRSGHFRRILWVVDSWAEIAIFEYETIRCYGNPWLSIRPSSSMIPFLGLRFQLLHPIAIAHSQLSWPGLTCMQPRARPQRFRPGKIWARLCHLADVTRSPVAWWRFFFSYFLACLRKWSFQICKVDAWWHIPSCNGLTSRLREKITDLDQMVCERSMKREGRQNSTIFHKRGLQLSLDQAVASSPVAFWHGSDSSELQQRR